MKFKGAAGCHATQAGAPNREHAGSGWFLVQRMLRGVWDRALVKSFLLFATLFVASIHLAGAVPVISR